MQCVVRRVSNNLAIKDDRCHQRRPQFLVQLTESNCISDYSINTLNQSTNTAATVRELPTILTERSQGRRRKRESGVCHRNLVVIKLVRCSKLAKQLTIFSLNCCSVKNKALSIADLVTSRGIDILAVTETWIGSSADAQVFSALAPPGYNILHVARPDERPGGVAVLFKEGLGVKTVNRKDDVFTQFEHMECSVKTDTTQVRLCLIYRPPPSTKNGFSITDFFDEWSAYLDYYWGFKFPT